jgi:TonB family protein
MGGVRDRIARYCKGDRKMGFWGQYGLMLALAIVPAGAVAKGKAAAAHPLGNPGQYFGADAYPPEAIRAEEQGRVVATVDIDASGTATGCKATVSSGSTALDAKTCAIATTNVKYAPALDSRGRHVAGSYVLPVRWVLPTDSYSTLDGAQQSSVSFSGTAAAPVCSVMIDSVARHIVPAKCKALVDTILSHGGNMGQQVSLNVSGQPDLLAPLGE